MPSVFEPKMVIETENVAINEFFGNASAGTPEISVAHVKSKGAWREEWQVGAGSGGIRT
jgi:hypothetical protein